jgi:hypothetical protein
MIIEQLLENQKNLRRIEMPDMICGPLGGKVGPCHMDRNYGLRISQ